MVSEEAASKAAAIASMLKPGKSGARLFQTNPAAVTSANRSSTADRRGTNARERLSGRFN